jgi:ABC-type dipeptide/oligopeptide/nickel transport system permease subunit
MLVEGRRYVDSAWWIATFSGTAIFLTVASINLVGDGWRDALDPRRR